MEQKRILIVDDEQDLCEILRYNLTAAGYQAEVAYSAEMAIEKEVAQYDLLLLDVMMPGMSGFELARQLKGDEATASVPIIFLTAKDTEEDMLHGFGLGADDYVKKPFSVREVMARVKAVLCRRESVEADKSKTLQYEGLVIDLSHKSVKVDGEAVALTKTEFELLVLLLTHRGKVFSRQQILESVWPQDVIVTDRTVDVTEGTKMWMSVMVVFAVYAIIFILFEDYDRAYLEPFEETSDWHLLLFSLVVMGGLGLLLHRYARWMDERISREQAEKENQLRRELTQNISHELKTPVASILGYTETILDDPQMNSETQRQFIQRTHAQAQRLTALLQDISTLNRMDYAAHQLAMERTDVSEIVSDIVQETAIAVEKHHMTVHNDLPEDIIIQGNPSLIYSIFRNLIDNAINYAGEGTTIDIQAEQTSDGWKFRLSDNGVGIAPEHLSRIFERFYRIDKGRSRSLGGTGLGLAIVKNAVLLHGGSITVRPADKGGLAFEFTLRKSI